MRPSVWLDDEQLAANARAWREFAGVPVRAVVKGNGYGWGMRRIAAALEGTADSFCVADLDELRELRAVSGAPAIVLGAVAPDNLREVLESNATPTVSTGVELDALRQIPDAPSRVRVGIRTAAAWSGLSLEELPDFIPRLAAAGIQVELWTHITDLDEAAAQLRTFELANKMLEDGGIRVSGTDVCSTFPLAAGVRAGSSVRIGAGLFGATGGPVVPGVGCAVRFSAPVLRKQRHSAGTRIGYGGTMLGMDCTVAILRGGFSDGLPAGMQGRRGVLMVGMQYAAVDADTCSVNGNEYCWLDRSSSLDEFALAAGRPVHEIITALGHASASA